MKRLFAAFIAVTCSSFAHAQTAAPYRLIQTIALPGVQGGFDHLEYDQPRQRLYLAGSDSGTVQVINLRSGQRTRILKGFTNPHSIVLRARKNEILVTDSGVNASAMLNATTLQRIKTLDLALGANCAVLSHDRKTIFVTGGGDRVRQPDSTLQAIDADTGEVRMTVHVSALHLQPMALDASGEHVFVNVADKDTIAVFDSKTLQATGTWPLLQGHRNSPIVFDSGTETLFVIATDPGILIALDPASGALKTSIPTPERPDDLGFDPKTHRLFVPGEKKLAIYQIDSPSSLRLLQTIPTPAESHTGIFLPDHNAFAVATPQSTGQPASVLIFGAKR